MKTGSRRSVTRFVGHSIGIRDGRRLARLRRAAGGRSSTPSRRTLNSCVANRTTDFSKTVVQPAIISDSSNGITLVL